MSLNPDQRPSGGTNGVFETARLEQLFEQAPGFMAVATGPEHVFEMANASYRRLVGPREVIGRTVRECFPDLEGQSFFELLDHVYKKGIAVTGRARPLRIQREPGAEPEERFLDFVFQPIKDLDGRVTGIFVEGNDVTHLHEVELALRESEERFRLIADSAPVPMWVTKLDRTRNFVNRAYAEFLDVSYEEALGFDWRTRIHPEDAPRLLQESLAGEATLEPFALEGRYMRADGDWRWLRSVSQPRWGTSGEHIGFIGVAHDVTEAREAHAALRALNESLERRVEERTADLQAALERLQQEVGERQRAEELLRQAQKMEAVGQLTGGIAHDFNNLLTPIMGGLEIIASRLEDERLKRMAGNALDAARRGAKLTGQLLAFSRIQRISMAPVAVNEVIGNMRDMLRHTIGADVAIETALAPEVSHALCDANQLENAVLNLAINARDAMPEGGTLTISTSHVEVGSAPDLQGGAYVRVSVSDTGEGMPADVLQRATEPFFSTKPVGKGTGLGLAQVYGIAHQSGGTLRIESEVGRGTTVHILLPAAAEAMQPAGPDAELQDRVTTGSSATVLVVDDDNDVREFLAVSLDSLGYNVVEASSGREGLDKLAARTPDLILLDYAMPGMHGGEVERAGRETNPDVPIVLVTGYAATDQIVAALGHDVPVLRKPFSVAQLAATVEEHLRTAARTS